MTKAISETLIRELTKVRAACTPVPPAEERPVKDLTIQGGYDKNGDPESTGIRIETGDIVCIVGPTGSGKSRLLADIECLADGDTPSGRRILVNGRPADPDLRFRTGRKLIAQLSQNMNFVVDLSVGEFLEMHADCRRIDRPDEAVRSVIASANALAGEAFSAETSLTQLSGGQSRALMIADAALLSASPIMLIDEIENAGIDRKKALDLLISREKIVLISTHDPILALMGSKRIVIRNGGIADVIVTSPEEARALSELEAIDRRLMAVRQILRSGGRVDRIGAVFGTEI